jgi:hypothetical protein
MAGTAMSLGRRGWCLAAGDRCVEARFAERRLDGGEARDRLTTALLDNRMGATLPSVPALICSESARRPV